MKDASDPAKLRLIADWFDMKYSENESEVSRDLREIAEKIERMQEELNYFKTWKYF